MLLTSILPKSSDLGLSRSRTYLLSLLAIISFAGPSLAQAEFNLNFQADDGRHLAQEWLFFNCNRSGGGEDCNDNDEGRDENGPDTTPFHMSVVRDPQNGNSYYHTIIGRPGEDFVQDAFIQLRRNCSGGGDDEGSCGGGDDQGPISQSGGNTRVLQNNRDPLGPASFSGSGTADPSKTIFSQILDQDGFEQEITKATYTGKSLLTQEFNLESGNAIHKFGLDMRNSQLDNDQIAGEMTINYFKLTGSGINGTSPIEYDITDSFYMDRGGFDITGGKYKYVHQGYAANVNAYSGDGSGYNIWEEDWWAWRDPAQNPNSNCRSSDDGDDNGPRPPRPRCHLYGNGNNGDDN